MTPPDRGPLDTYQIIWMSGETEEIKAHQVSIQRLVIMPTGVERVDFHGEFDGRWKLVFSAPLADIRIIRRFTAASQS